MIQTIQIIYYLMVLMPYCPAGLTGIQQLKFSTGYSL